jgi:hypothetical protein
VFANLASSDLGRRSCVLAFAFAGVSGTSFLSALDFGSACLSPWRYTPRGAESRLIVGHSAGGVRARWLKNSARVRSAVLKSPRT